MVLHLWVGWEEGQREVCNWWPPLQPRAGMQRRLCHMLWLPWTYPEAIHLQAGGSCKRKTPIWLENCQPWRMLISASLENSQALCKRWNQEMNGKQLEWSRQRGQPTESKRRPGSGPTPESPAEVSWACFPRGGCQRGSVGSQGNYPAGSDQIPSEVCQQESSVDFIFKNKLYK